MAVEFTDHAAAAMVAMEKGWFADAGIEVTGYESYVTGVDLAAAVARGDIQAAYICLVPALNIVANAGIPVHIVAGTHKYGYGLVVNPAKVTRIEDLADPDVKIACVQPGAAADVLLHRLCDNSGLPAADIEARVQRMTPPAQVLALQAGAVDACLMPEHWTTLAENLGFTMLATARDIWPELEGSVLVVKQDLIREHPEVVQGLVDVTRKATEWMGRYPDEAAAIVAKGLSVTGPTVFPAKAADAAAKLQVTPEVVARSMSNLEYTVSLDPAGVQEVIDYVTALGYLKTKIDAAQVLDLTFLAE
jgi:NitT/TauT family transport system substrate-binding protein